MTTELFSLLAEFRLLDAVDIALLSVAFYWILRLIEGTRTMGVLNGLFMIVAVYALVSVLSLDAVSWILDALLSSVVIIVVVLFQADIRNALARMRWRFLFRDLGGNGSQSLLEEVVEAAYALTKQHCGGTIVLEQSTGLRNYAERGRLLDAQLSAELLQSIFQTGSPLHDGAVIIDHNARLLAARCILPISTQSGDDESFLGTRHRSALGISEETDAIVVVISEEQGSVSLVHQGRLWRNLAPVHLRAYLIQLLQGSHIQDDAILPTSQADTSMDPASEVSSEKLAGAATIRA